jgi:hypothetical protein
MAPNHSLSNRSNSIEEEKYANAGECLIVQYRKKGVYVEDCHQTESAQNTQRACYNDGNAEFGKAVPQRGICERGTR